MPLYEILLLDADRTLFDFDAAEDLALTNVLTAHGLPSDPAVRAVYVEENRKAWDLFEQGVVTKPRLTRLRFENFLARMGLEGDAEILNRDYLADLGTHCIPLPGAEETCRRLAEHCRLYIVTNGVSAVQHGRMSRCSFRDCFSGMFVSEDLDCQKPQAEYFEKVAARIPGFDAGKVLVVGDSLSSDIRGANNAGLPCCWYNPGGESLPADIRCDHQITGLPQLAELVLG